MRGGRGSVLGRENEQHVERPEARTCIKELT